MDGTSRQPAGFHFLTAVWGSSYVRLYLDVVIPAQLAPGNLVALSGDPGIRYVIYAPDEDAETIRNSSIFRRLCELVEVTIEPIDFATVNAHEAMSICHRQGIAAADAVGAAVVFLAPDIVFADGAFSRLRNLVLSGRDVVFIPAIRALKSGALAALDPYRDRDALCVRPPQLMQIAFANQHPLARASLFEEGDEDLIPPLLYWRVPGEGLVARCFHLHPLAVFPQRKNARFFGTVDDDFASAACPDESRDYIVSDSDEIAAIELSGPDRVIPTGIPKRSVSGVIEWAERGASLRHRRLFQATLRMHGGTMTRDAWAAAESRAAAIAEAINRGLASSWWSLLRTRRNALRSRLARYEIDRKLAVANGRAASVADIAAAYARGPDGGAHRANKRELMLHGAVWRLVMWHDDGMVAARRFYRRINRILSGPVHRPRPWSPQWNYLRQVNRLTAEALAGCERVAVLCGDENLSAAVQILRADGRAPVVVAVAESGGSVSIVDKSTGESLPDASCDAFFVDRDYNFGGSAALCRGLPELARLLDREGRLIVFVERLSAGSGGAATGRDGEELLPALTPIFQIEGKRFAGGKGSRLCFGIVRTLRSAVIRSGLPLLALLPVALIAIPFRLAVGPLLQIVALVLDRIDTRKDDSILTAAVAVKATGRAAARRIETLGTRELTKPVA